MVTMMIVHSSMNGWMSHLGHVHVPMDIVHLVLHLLAFEIVVIILFFSLFRSWVHSIVFVCFAFVVGLLFCRELLPGGSHQPGNGPSLGRNTTFRLFQSKHVRGEE